MTLQKVRSQQQISSVLSVGKTAPPTTSDHELHPLLTKSGNIRIPLSSRSVRSGKVCQGFLELGIRQDYLPPISYSGGR